jgi:hypothetical protein
MPGPAEPHWIRRCPTVGSGCRRAGTRRRPRPRWSSARRRTGAAARPPSLGLDGSVCYFGAFQRFRTPPISESLDHCLPRAFPLPCHPASFPVCMAISRPAGR